MLLCNCVRASGRSGLFRSSYHLGSRHPAAVSYTHLDVYKRQERYSDRILRTPDVYGYFTATFNPTKALSVALNGNYTGQMYVPHLMSEVDGTADLLVKSPDFFELGAKVAYDIDFSGMCLQFNVGVQNIFNSYQKDFDKGAKMCIRDRSRSAVSFRLRR